MEARVGIDLPCPDSKPNFAQCLRAGKHYSSPSPLLSRTTLPEAVHAHLHAQWDSAIEVTHNLSVHVLTHLLRDCLPRSLRQQRIEHGQACLEENLAVARIVRRLALALDQAQCRLGVSTQSELGLRLLSVL